ncbi:FecR domain-containing protein [Pseudomonas sp. SD17-1]|uniref:FecR family protein n=1 Tax=Pseudomonas sp. SD17-1 TaxID=2976883 RepID=UPI0023DAC2AF|nr:FecR domain-containing protein [Pseudomonas sp. SD17-1]WEJ20878.1 FecR domain-containing protein [Pseudomonas sp. SD17-1]
MNAPAPPTAEQQQAALAWLGQINQQPARAEGAAFKRWLLADPAHPQAWRQAQALWQQTAAPAARLAAEDAPALEAYLRAMDRPRRRWPARVAGLALAASVVLGVAMGAGWHPANWVDDLGADYVAAVGELKAVTLADQSHLLLDADSAIDVDFSGGQRRVQVRRGAVFFEVTHTGAPFTVQADGGEVRVMGTRFEVRRQPQGTTVTVLSGKVGVTPASGQAQQVLTAGQQVEYAQGLAGAVQGVDSENRLAWRQGWLNYYQAPLAQVVDDLARHYPGRIVLLDDALAARTVSGSFPAADPLAALDALGAVAGFQRKTLLGRVTLLR